MHLSRYRELIGCMFKCVVCVCYLSERYNCITCELDAVHECTPIVSGAEGGMDVPDKDYDDDGGDSKSLRLTLMEEVLLLGLKDREVRGLDCRIPICIFLVKHKHTLATNQFLLEFIPTL